MGYRTHHEQGRLARRDEVIARLERLEAEGKIWLTQKERLEELRKARDADSEELC